MKGYEVIESLQKHILSDDIIVSSNGNISREVFHLLPQPQIYLRGSMGLPVSVGLGLALAEPTRRILVITGDGNFLMGLGASVTAAHFKPSNLKILILDNNSYFTTGGQETVSSTLNYSKFLESLNSAYTQSTAATNENINDELTKFLSSNTFAILHLAIEEGKMTLANIPWHPKEIAKRVIQKHFLKIYK